MNYKNSHRLYKALQERGYTGSRQSVWRWWTGKAKPNLANAVLLAKVLETTTDNILKNGVKQ